MSCDSAYRCLRCEHVLERRWEVLGGFLAAYDVKVLGRAICYWRQGGGGQSNTLAFDLRSYVPSCIIILYSTCKNPSPTFGDVGGAHGCSHWKKKSNTPDCMGGTELRSWGSMYIRPFWLVSLEVRISIRTEMVK